MRVFTWVNYGNTAVYRASDNEDLKFIFLELYEALRDLGIEDEYPEHEIPLSTFREVDVYALIDAFGGYSVHETIEFGTGFCNLKTRD